MRGTGSVPRILVSSRHHIPPSHPHHREGHSLYLAPTKTQALSVSPTAAPKIMNGWFIHQTFFHTCLKCEGGRWAV